MISAGQDENYSAMQKFYIQALRNVKGKKRIGNENDFEAISILETELGVALNTAADGRAILPPFISLIIDEGHLLDESFSSSLSDYVSLTSVHSDLQSFHALGGKMMAGGLEIVANSIKALIAHAPTVDRRDFVALSGDGEGKLTPHLIAIATVCDSIDGVRAAGSDKYRLSLKIRRAGVIFSASVTRNRRTSFLRHSPIRQLPQLFVSNSNVQTILSRLWTSLESAALVSATLYMPTNDGPSSNFMSSLLQIPLDRLQTFPPVHEVWSTACVEGAWLPQSSTAWLCPPTISVAGSREKRTEQERQVAEVQWHADLASEIEKIWQFAAGGVLVLCTSYVTVQALHQMLCDKAHLANLLVAASPSHALRSQGRAFLGISHSGLKPLWLAVGSAWTGLDIGGHDPWTNLFGSELPAAEDNVLTDLVIPRVPYGTNQSLSHLWRIRNNPNVPWDLFDAALRFKQALGRLVRRDGLPNNRRIFVLDARMQDGMNGPRMTAFTQSLSKYKRKRLIKVT
jgi:CRISPR type IV-associated DEAD/DEAH-box helicase Csf4